MSPHNNSRSTGPDNPSVQTYGAATRILHWLMVPLVLAQFMISVLMPEIGPKTAPGTLVNLHLSFGFVIFVVMATRLPLALIGLHAVATICHHFVLRDGELRRMLPASGKQKSRTSQGPPC